MQVKDLHPTSSDTMLEMDTKAFCILRNIVYYVTTNPPLMGDEEFSLSWKKKDNIVSYAPIGVT
jgi:hypothetical protein